jgi:hypothetical protein
MLKQKIVLLLAVLLSLIGAAGRASAGLIGSPLGLLEVVEQIRSSEAALADYSRPCMRSCKPVRHGILFRGSSIRVTK